MNLKFVDNPNLGTIQFVNNFVNNQNYLTLI